MSSASIRNASSVSTAGRLKRRRSTGSFWEGPCDLTSVSTTGHFRRERSTSDFSDENYTPSAVPLASNPGIGERYAAAVTSLVRHSARISTGEVDEPLEEVVDKLEEYIESTNKATEWKAAWRKQNPGRKARVIYYYLYSRRAYTYLIYTVCDVFHDHTEAPEGRWHVSRAKTHIGIIQSQNGEVVVGQCKETSHPFQQLAQDRRIQLQRGSGQNQDDGQDSQ